MEKFCLKWDDFGSNVGEYFRKLREDQRLFDVTLATEDGQEIKAHKIVLSAGSDFFNNIFLRNNHPNMYIFLNGVSKHQLDQVTDFLYYGEASMTQEEMKHFLETAKLLQVRGLQGDIQSIGQYNQNEVKTEFDSSKSSYEEPFSASQETIVDSFNSLDDLTNDTLNDQRPGINENLELDRQVADMIEKTEEGKWKCKVCGRIALQKNISMNHAETHIKGLSFTCPMCSKACSTRQNLRDHISGNHTGGTFSCNICSKTDMNRKEYHNHNRHHKLRSKIV